MVCMKRDVPEVANGPTTINVQEQDIPVLESRGWIVSKPAATKKEDAPAVKEEVSEEKTEESSKKKNKF